MNRCAWRREFRLGRVSVSCVLVGLCYPLTVEDVNVLYLQSVSRYHWEPLRRGM